MLKKFNFYLIKRIPLEAIACPRQEKVEVFYGTAQDAEDEISRLNTDPQEDGYFHTALLCEDAKELQRICCTA